MILSGKLHLFSETGTEGGYWAFQDSNHISWISPSFGISNRTEVREINNPNRLGLTSNCEIYLNQEWLPFEEKIEEYAANNLKIGEELILKDGIQNSLLSTTSHKPNRPFEIRQDHLTRITVTWDDGKIDYQRKSDTLLIEEWSYEGLHILKDGDKLKIQHPIEDRLVWNGIVELQPVPFTEHINGMRIKADQKGISRGEWSNYFFKEFLALLEVG